MTNNPVLLVVAHEGYQQIEYTVPKKILLDQEFTVVTASNKSGAAIGKDGSTTTVDIVLDDVKNNDYQGIFFIGGPGALENLDNKTSYEIIQQAAQDHLPLGAICVSTRILAYAQVLEGKQATGWDGDNKLAQIYSKHGVTYVREKVVVDENIITATGPEAAEEFGKKIVEMLQDNKGWG